MFPRVVCVSCPKMVCFLFPFAVYVCYSRTQHTQTAAAIHIDCPPFCSSYSLLFFLTKNPPRFFFLLFVYVALPIKTSLHSRYFLSQMFSFSLFLPFPCIYTLSPPLFTEEKAAPHQNSHVVRLHCAPLLPPSLPPTLLPPPRFGFRFGGPLEEWVDPAAAPRSVEPLLP